jgi:hypothetical protein
VTKRNKPRKLIEPRNETSRMTSNGRSATCFSMQLCLEGRVNGLVEQWKRAY